MLQCKTRPRSNVGIMPQPGAGRRRRLWALRLAGGFMAVAAGLAAGTTAHSALERGPIVYVVPVHGPIDLGLAPFLARSVRDAEAAGAAAIVLDINTFGGRVDAAVAMRDTLLNAPIRSVAFVNQRAISAGALIALACETIVMTPGGTLGAATPVLGGPGEPETASEKTISYVRKEFRATAEARKRPPLIAEAMVDPDVEIAGVIEKGKLLTLSAAEALQHRVADHGGATIDAALAATGLGGAELRVQRQTWAESVVRFLTDPIVSSLLMSLGLLGLFIEIRTPGFGVAGAVGLGALALFFWGHWIVQLAGWEELLLFAAGLILIAIEAFVLPGFGVAGVAGILAVVGGLSLALVGAGATIAIVIGALGRVAIALLVAMLGGALLLRFLPHLPFGKRLILATDMRAEAGYTSPPPEDEHWRGRTGTALSPLRPAGIADIDGARVDVVSDGAYIDAGTPVVVTRVDGNRIVVRRAPAGGAGRQEA
jgi:membrane-bound serine protease (ClpP class)